jgi:biopolymer transport protein ExbD
MAQILPAPVQKGNKRNHLHKAASIDMTPMVDLAFLLITFFIFTTTMSDKHAMRLIMPKEGPPSGLASSKALTMLLSKEDKVYVYEGNWEDAQRGHRISELNFKQQQQLRSLIQEKQRELRQKGVKDEEGLTLIIKPLQQSTYRNIVDALDETVINNIKRYAVVEPEEEEKRWIGL